MMLTNTSLPLADLVKSPTAILLENARIDTDTHGNLMGIPEQLRSHPDNPGAYIVQCKGPISERFRESLQAAGASIVSYIPNNALLVQASGAAAGALREAPGVQAVLNYEPGYKLKQPLLDAAMESRSLPEGAQLTLLLFAEGMEDTRSRLKDLGGEQLNQFETSFGPAVTIRGLVDLAAIARLPGVQAIELSSRRLNANDLSRTRLGVAGSCASVTNFLGLTGAGVLLALNDTGVDSSHPDLAGRITGTDLASLSDTNGHGTFIAGVIAGSGAESATVKNASGSPWPFATNQFRGKAPETMIFSVVGSTDSAFQAQAAEAGARIANNSWAYDVAGYDLAAASYDAATRDALPGVTGSQPMLFVFAAGNAGAGDEDDSVAIPDTIRSPATAKNVIAVGALEQFRSITNLVVDCGTQAPPVCVTNQPWLGMTSASNRLADFSSRGNIGLGIEGEFGRFKPDVVAPGTFVAAARSGQWDQGAYYSNSDPGLGTVTNSRAASLMLSNLNGSLGPFYRYESGSSVSAAQVSGMLALLAEYFEQRLYHTNSPALMKALLINGARSVAEDFDYALSSTTNHQGWGLPNLTQSLGRGSVTFSSNTPAATLAVDQDAIHALATGAERTFNVTVNNLSARNRPLRATLAWTDPPGNPVAGLKLVNDLDLIVTNLDTGAVYYGNDIPAGTRYSSAWNPDSPAHHDRVNNLENVFLAPPLGTSYTVTVRARAVNVNAVTRNPADVVQDFALVVSSGDGEDSAALTLRGATTAISAKPEVTILTNAFYGIGATELGRILLDTKAGANSPLADTNVIPVGPTGALASKGALQQWRFYVLTNATSFTNAAFLTFQPDETALPAATVSSPGSLANMLREADIDLYVSTNSALTNLNEEALSNAWKSLGRGGTETIVLSNAVPGTFYVGVKSEDQQAAQYSLLALISEQPFSQRGQDGSLLLRGLPADLPMADASASGPGQTCTVAIAPVDFAIHRVVVTNLLDHERFSDLNATLKHDGVSVTLNNHSPMGAVTNQSFVYDDSDERDISGSQRTAGPGSLASFRSSASGGQWVLTQTDSVPGMRGTNLATWLLVENQPDFSQATSVSILPGACREDWLLVTPETTNLVVNCSVGAGAGPLVIELCPAGGAGTDCQSSLLTGPGATVSLSVDKTSLPPLNPGAYILRLRNSGIEVASLTLEVLRGLDPAGIVPVVYTWSNAIPINDDAVTRSSIFVGASNRVFAVQAGIRIDHPRISDLALRLLSPSGTSVLLCENRGGLSTNGMGLNVTLTNLSPVSSSGGPNASTNTIDTAQTSGTVTIDYNFYALPDTLHVYYEGKLIFDSGSVSNAGTWSVNYGPGNSTLVTVIINEGGNFDPNTAWDYVLTSIQRGYVYSTFTENTNLAAFPIKFATSPFAAPVGGANYFLPEESLQKFMNENAQGPWSLEIADTRAGAASPEPRLVSWQLQFLFNDALPAPLTLQHEMPRTLRVGAGQIQYFEVTVPDWASATAISLSGATGPVNLLFNQNQRPTGTNAAGDYLLLGPATEGTSILTLTNGPPGLEPGARFYLAVQNTNASPVTFTVRARFDVLSLQPNVAAPWHLASPGSAAYFSFEVQAGTAAVMFELMNLTGNANLVLRKGLPFPTGNSFNYGSFNPDSIGEQILVLTNSAPVPLSPGPWYAAAVNADAVPITGDIIVRDFPYLWPSISIIKTQVNQTTICLTWTSMPGTNYYLQGKIALDDPAWINVSSTVQASDYLASACVPTASGFTYFRVVTGSAPPPTSVAIGAVTAEPGGYRLSWTASSNALFRVEWISSLALIPNWIPCGGVITSATGQFTFLDDGSQTGGFDRERYYRLVVLQ